MAEWWRSYYYLSKQLVGCLDRASLRSGPHIATSSLIMTFLGLAPDRRFEQMHCGKEVPGLPEHCYCWADREKGQLIKIIERTTMGYWVIYSGCCLLSCQHTQIQSNSFTDTQVQWCCSASLAIFPRSTCPGYQVQWSTQISLKSLSSHLDISKRQGFIDYYYYFYFFLHINMRQILIKAGIDSSFYMDESKLAFSMGKGFLLDDQVIFSPHFSTEWYKVVLL